MLRQLPEALTHAEYDAEFLKGQCAVLDGNGRIRDLYIAMTVDSILWAELKEIPVYKTGLEAAWEYDHLLDYKEWI